MRRNGAEGAGSAGEEEASPSGQQEQEEDEGSLVGTVEISIAASSRTRFLTLNAPEVATCCCAAPHAPCMQMSTPQQMLG